MPNLNEIIYCNITLQDKNRQIILKEIVTKNVGSEFYHKQLSEKYKIKVPLKVVSIEVIKSLGYANK